MRWWKAALAVAVAAAVAIAVWYLLPRGDALPPGLSAEEYAAAEARYRQIYPDAEPDRVDVLSLAAELAVADERWEAAVASFREIPSDHPRYGMPARLQEGQVLVRLGRAEAAEKSLRDYLTLATANTSQATLQDVVLAYKWLTFILSVELRLEERKPVLAQMHGYGIADVLDSKQYCFPNLLILNSPAGRQRLEEFIAEDPDNPVLKIALGRYRTLEGRLEEAQEVLEAVHRERPHDLHAAAALLESYFEEDDQEAFARVAGKLPEAGVGEPWLLTRMRGEWALIEQRFEDAVSHFQRALEEDPAYLPCQMGLAQAYAGLSQAEEREEALRRASVLAEIRVELSNVEADTEEPITRLVAKCEQIGFERAAEIFQAHAEAIRRRAGSAAPSGG